jgi:hypothetical protein
MAGGGHAEGEPVEEDQGGEQQGGHTARAHLEED